MANSSPIPQQSVIKILILVVLIVAVAFLLNIKSKNRVSQLNRELVQVKSDIERQKVLYPVYERFKNEVEREVVKELELVSNKAMTQEQVDEVTQQIEQAAYEARVEPQQVTPDPSTMAENSGQLIVNSSFFGNFFDMRELLKNLGAIPYVRHIEIVQMQEALNGLVVNIQLRLSVQTEAEENA